jgi:hypothetical protein
MQSGKDAAARVCRAGGHVALSPAPGRVIVNLVTGRRVSIFVSYVVAVLACGSRTGLLLDGTGQTSDSTEPPPLDAGRRALDAGRPVARDASPDRDADVGADVLPPVAVTPHPPMLDCPDAAATLIYLITEQGLLIRFDPPAATFTTIGRIACPALAFEASADTPNSMAVDHLGTAYVGFRSGELFRVSTATAACQATPFVPGQQNFSQVFGMGYATNADGGETLYVGEEQQAAPSRLASIDTTTFALDIIGAFRPTVSSIPELTGTGAGDLFAFYALGTASSAIGQIDRESAAVVAQSTLTGLSQGSAWAFAFWGGDFYLFTAPGAPDGAAATGSEVHRYRPSDNSLVEITRYPDLIVGAGVSTCAPQQ